MDSILNEGHFSASGLAEYRKKYEIKHAGVLAVRQLVTELGIDCDLEASGKYHCTALKSNEKKLKNFILH